MGGKSSSTPDYQGAAVAQGEANREVIRDQTFANRPDQYTPWGATSWNPYRTTDPATGEATTAWEQVQSLTPDLQSLLDKQVAMQGARTDIAGMLTGRMGAEFGTPMDWRGLNPMGQVPTAQFTIPEEPQRAVNYEDAPELSSAEQSLLNTEGMQDVSVPDQLRTFTTDDLQSFGNGVQQEHLDYSGEPTIGDPLRLRQNAESALYSKGQSRLQPQFDTKRKNLEIQLRNQGLGPQDEAWQAQMGAVDRQETDAYGQLQSDSVLQGMGEANQLFNQDATRRQIGTSEVDRQGGFFNDANKTLFDMNNSVRGQQFNERASIADFYNQSGQDRFAMQSGLRGQQLGERGAQTQAHNDAYNNLFNMNLQARNTFTNERDRQAQFFNQADQQAFNQAYGANQANFNQAMQGSQYANAIRQQQMTEAMQKRGFSLNEMNALLSGQQVNSPQMPNFSQASAAQPAPIYQGAVDQGNAAAMNNQSFMSGLTGLAGAAASAYTGGIL